MSLSKPNAVSFLIKKVGTVDQAVTVYTSPEAATAAFEALLAADAPAFLYLEAAPTKELKDQKFGGAFQDAYGTWRVVGDADTID